MEQLVELPFPTRGLDQSRGFAAQTPGTTPVGENVRAFEPSTDRARGGSRPGLAKYVAGQVPSGGPGIVGLIQHLAVVVDPTTDALLDNNDSDDTDAVDDPSSDGSPDTWGFDPDTGLPRTTRNPGRRIRNGGWGYSPNKNRRSRHHSPLAFLQAAQLSFGSVDPATPQSLPFSSNVSADSLIVVGVALTGQINGPPFNDRSATLSDTRGNTYHQAGGYANFGDPDQGQQVAVFYAFNSGAGACTVTVTPSDDCAVGINLVEYSGVTAFRATAQNIDAGPTNSMSTGTVSASLGDLVVGFIWDLDDLTAPGFNVRLSGGDSEICSVADKLGATGNTAVSGTSTDPTSCLGIAVSFRPSA